MIVKYRCLKCTYTRERAEGPGIFNTCEVLCCPTCRTVLVPELQRLPIPARCDIGSEGAQQCDNTALWAYNGFPLCQEHLRALADMNGDNYEAVKAALDNPLRIVVITKKEHQGIACASCEKRVATVWVVNMEDGQEVSHPRCDECKSRQLEVV